MKHATVVSGPQGRIEAFVELLPGRNTTGDQIAEFAAPNIPKGLRPERTTVLETMPRSFSGKADRRHLEQQVTS